MAEVEPKECPVCGDVPRVGHFAVNPMFGGGVAYTVRCPYCGYCDDLQYRSVEDAVEGWNALVNETDEGYDDLVGAKEVTP